MSSHFDVAAYALGTLDAPGTEAFESHLADCRNCQVELSELQELPGLLDAVAETWPNAPGGVVLYGLLAKVERPRRRQRLQNWGAGVAAAVLVFISGVVTATLIDGGDPPAEQVSAQPAALTRLDPVDGDRNGVSGSVETDSSHAWLEPTPHGSRLDLDFGGATGPTRCLVVAVSRNGTEQEVAAFDAPKKGERILVSGETRFAVHEIDRVEVRRVSTGKVLTTLMAAEK